MNTCGECTLCCKLVGVQELAKPPGLWCQHSGTRRTCDVYPDRPTSCRNFECGWLRHGLPPEYRPDHVHVIVAGEDDELGVTVLHVDPAYPDALERPLGRRLLAALVAATKYPTLLVNVGHRRYVANPATAAQLVRIQRQLESMPKVRM